jgi:1-acyl-sn-glycerol-3-phosphate acyltransferase
MVCSSTLDIGREPRALAPGTSLAFDSTGMTMFDGFSDRDKEAFAGFSAYAAEHLGSVLHRLGKRLHVELDGLDQLPRGRALLVANHAFGVWDIALAIAEIHAETGRTVWSLGEHLWWKVPVLRRVAGAVGVVDGTQKNVDALLAAGELVLVLPGGLREALKPQELRYRLLWGHRYGFVRAAMRNKAPIVPLTCIGGDDLFDLSGDAFARGRRMHLGVPLPLPARALSFVHRAHLRFVIGEPIPVEGRGDEHDEHAVRSLRREVEGAIHEMFEDELARRAGFSAGA